MKKINKFRRLNSKKNSVCRITHSSLMTKWFSKYSIRNKSKENQKNQKKNNTLFIIYPLNNKLKLLLKKLKKFHSTKILKFKKKSPHHSITSIPSSKNLQSNAKIYYLSRLKVKKK
jgi:hypothetical protein